MSLSRRGRNVLGCATGAAVIGYGFYVGGVEFQEYLQGSAEETNTRVTACTYALGDNRASSDTIPSACENYESSFDKSITIHREVADGYTTAETETIIYSLPSAAEFNEEYFMTPADDSERADDNRTLALYTSLGSAVVMFTSFYMTYGRRENERPHLQTHDMVA